MLVQLNEKVAEMVTNTANDLGLTADELTNKIIEWYFEDIIKEN